MYGKLPLDQLPEHLLDFLERAEGVQPLRPLLQLAGGLWAAQHQHCQDGELSARDADRLVEEVAVLRRTAACTAREPDPASCATGARAPARIVDSSYSTTGSRFVVWLQASRRRVQRERIRIRRRVLLLDRGSPSTRSSTASASISSRHGSARLPVRQDPAMDDSLVPRLRGVFHQYAFFAALRPASSSWCSPTALSSGSPSGCTWRHWLRCSGRARSITGFRGAARRPACAPGGSTTR